MKPTLPRRLLLALLLALGGCGASEPTRFYLLSPADRSAPLIEEGPIVFVDQATIAPYLDRAQLVTRVSSDQVDFADLQTWAEPPAGMITRFLVAALGARFGPGRVLETPARRDFDPDFRLALDISRFDGDQSGAMVVDARWTLLAGAQERFVATGRERIAEPATDPTSWESRVAGLGRALARLADRLGEEVEARAGTR